MALLSVPNELLYMVADFLDIGDHSSLTLVNRHLAATLQSHLRSRLRKLPFDDGKYALLAIHWCNVSKDYDQLKSLLKGVGGIAVSGARPRWPHRVCYTSDIYTSPVPCDDETFDWIRTRGLDLRLRQFGGQGVIRSWQGMTAVEHAVRGRHRRLLRHALSKEKNHGKAMHSLRYTAQYGTAEYLEIALSIFRETFGKASWEVAQRDALELAVGTRGVKFFLQGSQTTINSQDSTGRTWLHRAVGGLMSPPDEPVGAVSHPEVVRAILHQRVFLDTRDKNGMTALHIAAAAAFVDVVQLLLQGGADVNALDNEGCSPVHLAARAEQRLDRWEVVALLKDFGADLEIADATGVVAKDLIGGPRGLRSSVKRGGAK